MYSENLRKLINQKADSVRELFDLNENYNFDIKKLVADLGGKIVEENSDDAMYNGFDAKIEPLINSNEYLFQIRLGAFKSEKRQRFSIAHEIGHFFLHMLYFDEDDNDIKLREKCYNREKTTSQIEWEANEFAAALLMPRSLFSRIAEQNLNGNIYDVAKIAKQFNVSEQACNVRGKVLGLWQ